MSKSEKIHESDILALVEQTLSIIDSSDTFLELQKLQALAKVVSDIVDDYDIHPDIGLDLTLYVNMKIYQAEGKFVVNKPGADPIRDMRKGLQTILDSLKK